MDHPQKTRPERPGQAAGFFLGLALLLAGLVPAWFALRSVSVFPAAPLWKTALWAAGALVLLAPGVVLLLRQTWAGGEVRALCLGCLLALLCTEYMLTVPDSVREAQINEALAGYVSEDFFSRQVPMPDSARFVFYLQDSGHFAIPSWDYPRGVTDPERVNVVAAFHEQEDGPVELQIIRLEDWSLITGRTFDPAEEPFLERADVQAYVNGIMRGEAESE